MKMATPLIIEDFSWYTDKKRVKDLKNSSDLLKRKTHVKSMKDTVKEINKQLSAEASNKAFMQPIGKKNTAIGMLFDDFDRVETKMRNLHYTQKVMLKPKVTNEHSKWHENCNQALKAILEQWINSNHNMEWVSRKLVRNLKERGLCLTLCRLEDKLSLGSEKEWQLSEEIKEMIRRKKRPANESAEQPPTADDGNSGLTVQQIAHIANYVNPNATSVSVISPQKQHFLPDSPKGILGALGKKPRSNSSSRSSRRRRELEVEVAKSPRMKRALKLIESSRNLSWVRAKRNGT